MSTADPFMRHVTERVRRAKALAEAQAAAARFEIEQRLTAIIGQGIAGVMETDLDGHLVYANQRFGEMTGYAPDELAGKRFGELTAPEDAHIDREVVETLRRGEKAVVVEKRYMHKDGHFVWVLLSVAPLRDTAGRPEGTLALVLDITARKRAEELVRTSEERLRLAIENARLGTWHWNVIADEHVWSARMREMFGVAPDARLDYDVWLSTLHPDDRDVTDRIMQQAIAEHSEYKADYRVVWPDGSEHWITTVGHGVYDADGAMQRIEGGVIDIDDRKRAEERLRRSEEGLRLANA